MIPYNGFILSILMLPLMPLSEDSSQQCQEMKMEIKVAPANDQGATISLTTPADADLKIFLMPADASAPPKEVVATGGELRNIARGSYEIVIQDAKRKYCSVIQRLTVN
jgi:hypothetical protein